MLGWVFRRSSISKRDGDKCPQQRLSQLKPLLSAPEFNSLKRMVAVRAYDFESLEIVHKVGVALWASVSATVDQRLRIYLFHGACRPTSGAQAISPGSSSLSPTLPSSRRS